MSSGRWRLHQLDNFPVQPNQIVDHLVDILGYVPRLLEGNDRGYRADLGLFGMNLLPGSKHLGADVSELEVCVDIIRNNRAKAV